MEKIIKFIRDVILTKIVISAKFVIPAKAGISSFKALILKYGIPAFAGMTVWMLLSTSVHAFGTTANIVITSPSSNYVLDYKDLNQVAQSTVHPATPLNSTPVTAVYGLVSNVASTETTRSIQSGRPATALTHVIRSRSNPAAGVTINFSSLGFVQKMGNIGTPGNWSINSDVLKRKGILFDQTGTFVVIATADVKARYASVATVTVNYALSGHKPSQVVAYTAFNDQSYGGLGTVPVLLTFSIQGPNLVVLSNTHVVLDPRGGASLIPGAKVTYEYVVKNIGDVVANSIVINQAIPVHTSFYGISDSATVSENSSVVSTDVDYFNGRGTTPSNTWIGTMGSVPSGNITKLRFNKPTVQPGEVVTLNYAVTVN